MLRCYPARLTNSHWIASVLHASLDLGEHGGNRGFWDINVDFCICFVGKSRNSYSPRSKLHQEEPTENMKLPQISDNDDFRTKHEYIAFRGPSIRRIGDCQQSRVDGFGICIRCLGT